MIKRSDRISAFKTVGGILQNLRESEREEIHQRARAENAWFTDKNIDLALTGVQRYLDEEKLRQWTQDLPDFPETVKNVGVVMAGNIPLVGFHDFLTVLISGHRLWGKLSAQDTFLMKYIANLLIEIEPRFAAYIVWVDKLKEADAIVATGSDNTSRYFEYYFAKYPHIIRKNRTGVGIIRGGESTEALRALGQDVFQYFGLGCRNVAKLWVPPDYKRRQTRQHGEAPAAPRNSGRHKTLLFFCVILRYDRYRQFADLDQGIGDAAEQLCFEPGRARFADDDVGRAKFLRYRADRLGRVAVPDDTPRVQAL